MRDDVPPELLREVGRLNDAFQANRQEGAAARTDDTRKFHDTTQIKAAKILFEAYVLANPVAQGAITRTLIAMNEQPLQP